MNIQNKPLRKNPLLIAVAAGAAMILGTMSIATASAENRLDPTFCIKSAGFEESKFKGQMGPCVGKPPVPPAPAAIRLSCGTLSTQAVRVSWAPVAAEVRSYSVYTRADSASKWVEAKSVGSGITTASLDPASYGRKPFLVALGYTDPAGVAHAPAAQTASALRVELRMGLVGTCGVAA